MADSERYAFTFNAFIEKDGDRIPFYFALSPPGFDEELGHYCEIDCSHIRRTPTRIFGIDANHARKLALKFIKDMLNEGETVVDAEGKRLDFLRLRSAP